MKTAPYISIVDDDESIREAVSGLVETAGYGAGAFASAQDFLNSSQLSSTACLILDVQMPGMSGLQLQSHLLASGHRIPTIFVTAFPEAAARRQALQAGAIAYLRKPLGRQILIRHIRKALKNT